MKAINKATVIRETEKAIQMTFKCELYGEVVTVKNAWMPKSQIEEISRDGDVIEFTAKNDWVLDAKVRDYAKWVAGTFENIKSEIRSYLSPINNVKVMQCWN